ncbi:hypothetical protein BT63DRAFT_148567 [Microthyrium microscopicum]|uniref:Pentatricopeptide repeat protein n=1 Tax=Microthyrium microscopicum TaxID=703497 RepID=A0A6A6ULQ8_9PEZI|nr:hypothetical protein BT63DRAFT_148567 [Microthyrium microscopicum]
MLQQIPRLWLRRLAVPRESYRSLYTEFRTARVNTAPDHLEPQSSRRTNDSRGVTKDEKDDNAPDKDGITPAHWRHAKKEIVWLQADEKSFAERIEQLLAEGKESFAYALVQLQSKDKDAAVIGWNLLIKHRMEYAIPNHAQARRYFNDMKKRGQSPDAYTYGIMLSGFDNHPRPTTVVETAWQVFNTMLKDGSRVKPTILHFNKMIHLAGRAGNMELFWRLIQLIPEEGEQAADAKTYNFIFSSLRAYLDKTKEDTSNTKSRQDEHEIFDAGRAIWGAVINAWTRGSVQIDSPLVFAYCRFLQTSTESFYWDQVYSVVEQTTGIKRCGGVSTTVPGLQQRLKSGELTPSSERQLQKEIYSVYDPPANEGSYATLVKPSRFLLSMLMETATRLQQTSSANYYWDILVDHHDVKPDVVNVKNYLQALRAARASRDLVKVITKLDRSQIDHGTYRIGMSGCTKNSWRTGSCRDAIVLYKHRQDIFDQPDAKVVESFAAAIKVADDEEKIEALRVLGNDPIRMLEVENYGWRAPGQLPEGVFAQIEEATKELAKTLIGLYDNLINRKKVTSNTFAEVKNFLAEFVRSGNNERRHRTRTGSEDRYEPDERYDRSEQKPQINWVAKNKPRFGQNRRDRFGQL